jgi:adenosylmethionine-8-amino-7-oxononanoate aminotransferase
MTSQAVCSNLGHTVPQRTIDKISHQAQSVPFVYGGLAQNPTITELVEKVDQITPAHLSGYLFPSSGSEANEAAIRMARLYTGKQTILSFGKSYHGGTGIPLHVGADSRRNFVLNDPTPSTRLDVTMTCDQICDHIRLHGDDIAALITEPVIGSGGVVKHDDAFMCDILAACRDNNVLVIADEVMSGFGRTGKMWGHELYNENTELGEFYKPDIMTFAKGFTGAAIPMSGVACSATLHSHFQTNSIGYGSTYQAHPMAAVMAIETIDRMRDENVLDNVATNERLMRDHMTDLATSPLFQSKFRLHGAFGCMDMCMTDDGEVNDGIINYFTERMREHGIIHMFRPPLLHIAPPLNCTAAELADAFDRIHCAANDTVVRYIGEWQ